MLVEYMEDPSPYEEQEYIVVKSKSRFREDDIGRVKQVRNQGRFAPFM
jgi:hypothetical protein